MSGQHTQCCCPDGPPPPVGFCDCLMVKVDGVAFLGDQQYGCDGCRFCGYLNQTFFAPAQGPEIWGTRLCPVMPFGACGNYEMYILLFRATPHWILRVTIGGPSLLNPQTVIVWQKAYLQPDMPDCRTWQNEVLEYVPALSGSVNLSLFCDPTGSTVTISATPQDTSCDGGIDCPPQPEPSGECDSFPSGCLPPISPLPSQVRVIIGNGFVGGGLCQCPSGEFICDQIEPCQLFWEYGPFDQDTCTVTSIFVRITRVVRPIGHPGGGTANYDGPAVIVSLAFYEIFGLAGEPYRSSRHDWKFCFFCPTDGFAKRIQCWYGGALVPLRLDEIDSTSFLTPPQPDCAWDGVAWNDRNWEFCEHPNSFTPIAVQFLP